ncbi:MAG TPA: iron ABC transporter permease [Methylomirabilota bacterium]|jgi:iron(III) transport system permease protein|nr:iron ABC transporter permease [Methylomirabilota bacterium]
MAHVLTAPTPSLASRRSVRVEHVVMAVAVLALAVLVVLPLTFLVWGSMTADGRPTLVHFSEALGSRLYVQALRNSLVLGLWTAALSVAVGLPLAWAVSRTNTPAKRFVHLTAVVSYVTPPFLTAIAFVNLFGPNAGLVNRFVRDVLGAPALTFNVFSMAGLVLVTVPHTFPFVYLLAASALESVDASMEESAQILGASRWRTVAAVTVPLVAPAVLSGALIAFVNAIALFGSQAIIGLPGRVFTLPTRIYALFDYPPQYGLASAMSLIFVAITVVALYLQRRYLAKRSYVTLGGKGSRPQLVDLGPARWGVFAFCVGVFTVAVAAPYLTLLAVSVSKSWGLQFWQNLTLQHYRFVLFEYDVTRRAIWNSLLLASATATLAVLLGSLVGWIDLRTALRGRKLLDYASLIPLGLPGIVVAVALIQFWLRVPLPIYGTLLIILLAYTGRYVPLGVRSANAAFRQIDASLEETARVTGAGWLRTFRSVTLPLARPGLFAGWLLVFVPALQELSASILLFSSGSITLAVAVYNLYETGALEPVAALAIVTMLIITAAIVLATRLGRGAAGAGMPRVERAAVSQ